MNLQEMTVTVEYLSHNITENKIEKLIDTTNLADLLTYLLAIQLAGSLAYLQLTQRLNNRLTV